MKKVLIIGKDSYIGESLKSWLEDYSDKYSITIISSKDREWEKYDFARFETVVDVAGIAHINNISMKMKSLFYSINRDLTIELGAYSKNAGVKQFIFMSSMNVYGDYVNHLTDRNATQPTSFYGRSKLEGDIGLFKMISSLFKVASIRAPFVYGKGCKGNYYLISKIAKTFPIFPNYPNKKSVIYIDNLCEFIRLIIENESYGVFTPQNREIISTTRLVNEIAKVNKHKVYFIKWFNCIISIGIKLSKTIKKAFTNDFYDTELSDYFNFEYCVVSFAESIKRIELSLE